MPEVISENIVRKIQLLLQLAERAAGNEVEAAAAMAKAQELLAQYNLDLATVQDKVVKGGTNTPDDAMAKRDYAVTKRSAMYQWQRNLVRALAEANYCIYWTAEVQEELYIPKSKRKYDDDEAMQKRWVKRHKVLGRTANTMSVLMMVDYLMDTIERLLPYEQKERLSRSASSWREGCSDRLIQRIQAKAEAMKKADYATQGEAAYTTAIALRNVATAEEIGNYDFQNGAGAWAARAARMKANEERWAAQDKLNAEREAKELAELEAKLALETPAQKAKRLKAEAREAERRAKYSERYWEAQDRKAYREASRRDHGAYRAGSATAEKIGLDDQLKSGKTAGNLS
jgi:hypothetical protein